MLNIHVLALKLLNIISVERFVVADVFTRYGATHFLLLLLRPINYAMKSSRHAGANPFQIC